MFFFFFYSFKYLGLDWSDVTSDCHKLSQSPDMITSHTIMRNIIKDSKMSDVI